MYSNSFSSDQTANINNPITSEHDFFQRRFFSLIATFHRQPKVSLFPAHALGLHVNIGPFFGPSFVAALGTECEIGSGSFRRVW